MIIKFRKIAFAISILICILILIPNCLGGPQDHLWINCVDEFPEEPDGYLTDQSDFTLYIHNDAKFGADEIKLIISLPGYHNIGSTNDKPPHIITVDGVEIQESDWNYGSPTAIKSTNCNIHTMPPSAAFDTYFAYVEIGSIGEKDTVDDTIQVEITIDGEPPVRFDVWGFTNDCGCGGGECIILENPFSHNLTYIPEFPTKIVPILGLLGIIFILHNRRRRK